MYRGGFHFIGALIFMVLMVTLVGAAFGVGAAVGGTANVAGNGGWPLVGLIVALFALVLIFGSVGRANRHHGCRAYARFGPGGPFGPVDPFAGPAGGSGDPNEAPAWAPRWHGHHGRHGHHGDWRYREECREQARSALDDWHRQAHGEQAGTGDASDSGKPAAQ